MYLSRRHGRLTLLALAVWLPAAAARSLENVSVVLAGREEPQSLSGQALVKAQDGGMLLKCPDGALHLLTADKIRRRSTDSKPLVMLTREELTAKLLAELPPGFQVHQSKNYIVCYNTTRTYAQWTSSLLERLQKAFIAYWKKQGLDVKAPEQPLPVLVFGDQASYAQYARPELGAAVANVVGYYSIMSNRIMMYDLTGMQALRQQDSRRGSLHDISELLSLPVAEPLVATIVHEATHQISFNCGLQTRLVENPLWLSEGLAVFCETPDLNSSRTWSGIGNVNYPRWDRFRNNEAASRVAPLERMIGDDKIFSSPDTAVDCYAQAWAWNFFLIRWHPKEYAAYLKSLAARPLLTPYPPKERLAVFREHFGDDLRELEEEFYRRMDRVK